MNIAKPLAEPKYFPSTQNGPYFEVLLYLLLAVSSVVLLQMSISVPFQDFTRVKQTLLKLQSVGIKCDFLPAKFPQIATKIVDRHLPVTWKHNRSGNKL